MTKWKTAKLNEFASVSRGKSKHRPRNDPILFGGPYPFVQTGEVKSAGFKLNEATEYYSEFGLQQSKLWPSGTICVTIAANIAESTVLGIDACFPDSIIGVTAIEGVSDTAFLKYLIDFMKYNLQSVSSGTTQDNLSLQKLMSFDFPFPPYETQKKISNILFSFDDLIQNNQRRIEILQESAETLYREWFVHYRYPGHENDTMVDSELGPIPKGWKVKPLGEISEVSLGGTPSRKRPEFWEKGTIPWITSSEVNRLRVISGSEFISQLGYQKSSTKLIPKKSTLIAITGATLGQISLNEIECCTNQSIVSVSNPTSNCSEYIYLQILDRVLSLIQNASGSAQQHINKGVVEGFKIFLPDEELLDEFQKLTRPIFELLSVLLKENKSLIESRDLLLPRLISGELDVSDLDLVA